MPSAPHNRTPDNATPDDATPDNATPDDATPDDADHSDSRKKPSSSPPSSKSNTGGSNSAALIGALVAVGVVLIVLIIICVICHRRRKRNQMGYLPNQLQGKGSGYYSNADKQSQWGGKGEHGMRMPSANSWGGPAPSSTDMSSNYSMMPSSLLPPSPSLALGLKGGGTFTYEDLEVATNRFNEANVVGQGGFGYVHKGVLPNGKEVAVKSLKANSGQGEREFQAEIDIISRVHHRHLVSLVGYCIAREQRMLVYEFVPNKTLEYHLYAKGKPPIDWATRMRIALGSAKGLAYLHEDCHPRIIHRDIKAANILIDDSFEAKVADFGLAKLTVDNNTHVSTRVMGTFGYLAPEYAASGKLTEKSDVFSFGVMLLELMTGKRPVDITNAMEDSLVDWARPVLARALDGGNFSELADPFLEGNYNNEEMARMAACAAASIRHSARKRPKMSQIVRALEGDVQLDDLNATNSGDSKYSSPGYDTAQYQIDMNKIRQMALSSQDFTSGSSNDSHEMSAARNQHY